MNKELFETIMQRVPAFNSKIINGYSSERLKGIEKYITQMFKITQPKFRCDFKLVGISKATPEEYFQELTRVRNYKKRNYELAESELYMVKLHFELNGKPVRPSNLLLPYSKGYNLIVLRDATYTMLPVMADPAISISSNSIFIPTSCAPLRFQRKDYSVVKNGQIDSGSQIVYAQKMHQMHEKAMGKQRTISAKLTLVHYILALNGFSASMDYFTDHGEHIYRGDFNVDELPGAVESYDIYQSSFLGTSTKPKGWKGSGIYEPHTYRFAVKKEHNTPLLETFMTGVIYILDHLPEHYYRNDIEELESSDFWAISLGCIIHGHEPFIGNNRQNMEAHLHTVFNYLDDVTKDDLSRSGINVGDITELFVWIVDNIRDQIRDYVNGSNVNAYGKRLVVERYIVSDIITSINKLAWAFGEEVMRKKELTVDDAERLLARRFKADAIRGMVADHGEIEAVQLPGDNTLWKSTQRVCPQIFTGKRGKRAEINRMDPMWQLTPELYAYHNGRSQLKALPTGHGALNLFVEIKEDGTVIPHNSLLPFIEHTKRVIG